MIGDLGLFNIREVTQAILFGTMCQWQLYDRIPLIVNWEIDELAADMRNGIPQCDIGIEEIPRDQLIEEMNLVQSNCK
ncbi:hypothetical protein L596_019872 [Steinernema carpocapsae]|uniref:Uncharacterized protein n=1 Tax=Steinernema carpocapsae TaxID=34508 RepID=A0A4V6A0Q9_STECR|nr:hypothetical protein L596_019872 [Steinernema carpocapsae]